MYCSFCGNEIPSESAACPHCHKVLNNSDINNTAYTFNGMPYMPNSARQNQQPYNPYQPPYNPNPYQFIDYSPAGAGIKVLSFFIPLAGIILYFVDRDRKPNSAKSCLKMALISIGIQVALWILWFLFVILIASVGISSGFDSEYAESETRIYYGLIEPFLSRLSMFL